MYNLETHVCDLGFVSSPAYISYSVHAVLSSCEWNTFRKPVT